MSEPTKTYSITYSEKEKMVLFLPDKTGTKHASFLFNHFDFSTDFFNENGESQAILHLWHIEVIDKNDYIA